MAMKKLTRARNGRFGGVCAGIADYYGVDPSLVRVGAVLAFFAGFPVLFVYFIAMMVLPTAPIAIPGNLAGDDLAASHSAEVEWQADQVVLRYRQKILPHTVAWKTLFMGIAVLFTTLMGAAFSVAVLSAITATVSNFQVLPPVELVLFFLSTLFDPVHLAWVLQLGTTMVQGLGFATLAGAVVPVNHSLRCTPSALIIGRPLLPDLSISLSEISMVEQRPEMLEIMLESGKLLSVPLTGTEDITSFVTQLNRGQKQALSFQEELAQGADERRRLEEVLAARSTE